MSTPAAQSSMKERLTKEMAYDEEKYIMIVTYITVTQFVFCLLNSLDRVDPFVAVLTIAFYALNERDKKALATFLGFQVFSVVLDIVWLAMHGDVMKTSVTPSEVEMTHFVFATTVIGLILKVVVIIPVYKLTQEFPVTKSSDPVDGEPSKAPRIAKWIVGFAVIEIALSFFNSIARSDLYHCAILLVLYAINELDYKAIIPYALFTLFSLISDICYVSLHADDWADIHVTDSEKGAVGFVLVITWVALLSKVIFSLLTLILYTQLKKHFPVKPSEIGKDKINLPTLNLMAVVLVVQSMITFLSDISPFRKDVYVIVILMMIYAINEHDRRAVLAYVFFTFLTWVFDIIWLSKYPISDSEEIALNTSETPETIQFVWVFTLLGLFVKGGAMYPAYLIFFELPEYKPEEGEQDYGAKMKTMLAYNEEKYSKVVRNTAVTQLVLCFFNCLYRADPFAVIVVVAFYAVHEKDKKALLAYIFFMFLSFLLDIVWLAQHAQDPLPRLQGTHHFVVAMTIIGIFTKAFILYPAAKLYSALPEIKPSDRAPHIDPKELKEAFGEVVKDVLTRQINELEGQISSEPGAEGAADESSMADQAAGAVADPDAQASVNKWEQV